MNEAFKDFKKEKDDFEEKGKLERKKILINNIQKILKDNPIKINYASHTYQRIFDHAERVETDETGFGGSIYVEFPFNQYIAIYKDHFSSSENFNKDCFKITNNSFHTILTIMDKLIKASGYSNLEKEKMFEFVVNGLKSQVLENKK